MMKEGSSVSFPYVDRSKATRLFIVIAISGALGGFAAGYDIGVIGDALNVITIHLTLAEEGLAASGLLLGALFSSMIAGQITDKLGRKWILVFDAALFTAMPILLAVATINFATFMTWRVIEGFALGMDNVLAGIFIGEMVPTKSRNKYIATQQLMTVIGTFLALWIGYALTFSADWELMFGLGAIPAAIILILRVRLPESPRWLLSRDRKKESKDTLKKFFMVNVSDSEFDQIAQKLNVEKTNEATWKDVFSKNMRKYALIAIITGLFMQFSGINAIIFYTPEIFVHLGYSTSSAAFTSGWVEGVAELWPVFLAQFLLVSRLGTKNGFKLGSLGMALSAIVGGVFLLTLHGIALNTATIVLIFVFLFFFEAGYGVALWAFSPEIFPTAIRGRGTTLFMTADSLAGFIVTATFPYLLNTVGLGFTMIVYGIIDGIAFVYILLLIPNTKGKPLREGLETIASMK